jgi:hypothetical protein
LQPVDVKDDMPRSVSRRTSRHSKFDVLGSRFLVAALFPAYDFRATKSISADMPLCACPS